MKQNPALIFRADYIEHHFEARAKVQVIRQQRQRKTKSGITSTFSGLVYCADCGEKLYYGATNNGKREGTFFDCSLLWKHKDKCGTHFIRESVLERMVLKHIQLVMGYILQIPSAFHLRNGTTAPVGVGRKIADEP